jgi:hypothetical protein
MERPKELATCFQVGFEHPDRVRVCSDEHLAVFDVLLDLICAACIAVVRVCNRHVGGLVRFNCERVRLDNLVAVFIVLFHQHLVKRDAH